MRAKNIQPFVVLAAFAVILALSAVVSQLGDVSIISSFWFVSPIVLGVLMTI